MGSSLRTYRHYDVAKKLDAINLYDRGYGCVNIGKALGVNESRVAEWLARYRAEGLSGLERRSTCSLCVASKGMIVREVLEESLSLEQAALRYGVSRSAVRCWVIKVRAGGYESLAEVKKRGRPPTAMGRPKKKEPQTELEKLQDELRYLRAENAYLKKLRALVEERIARESGRLPEPSKD